MTESKQIIKFIKNQLKKSIFADYGEAIKDKEQKEAQELENMLRRRIFLVRNGKRKNFFKHKRLIQLLLFLATFFAIGNLWIRWHEKSVLNDEKNSERIVGPTRRPLTEWECDYCGKVIKYEAGKGLPYFVEVQPVLISRAEEHLKECEKAQSFLSNVEAKKDNTLTYDDEETLERKGDLI